MKTTLRASIFPILFLPFAVLAMEPVDDEQLSRITGQQGAQLSFRLRNNVDENLAPTGCTGLLNACRMGIEFAGREGIWLMLKDYYGYLEINDIRLTSSTLPSEATDFANAQRFLSQGNSPTCLIPGKSVANCLPTDGLAMKVSYPNTGSIGTYNDFNLFMNIGRTALEFDDGATPGYMRDVASGSVLGFRMSDSTSLNAPSRSKFMGDAYVFGF